MENEIFRKIKEKFGGKKVLVMGLGIAGGGAGVANFFHKIGSKITVTDLKTKKELKDSLVKIPRNIKLVLGKHRFRDFLNADFIIKNPAVPLSSPYLKKVKKQSIPVLTDAQIFFDFAPREKIIGITGTKGKTTACYLLYHFLKSKYKVLLTSVAGTSSLIDLFKADRFDRIIYELSSFDLENLKKSPHLAVITNIFPDHLDRHKSFAEYTKAKKNIVKWQKAGNFAIFPAKEPIFKKWAEEIDSKVFYFREKPIKSLVSETSFFAAKKAAEIVGLSKKEILKSFKSFKGEPHRLEPVKKAKGVIFINDSASTNPGSTIFALKKAANYFKIPYSKIILVVGGVDKNFEYKKLANKAKNVKTLILLPGSASFKIERDLKGKNANLIKVDSLKKAVEETRKSSGRGDVILFSPGAASFNLFRNAYDRGEKFKKIVKNLK